MMFIERVLRLWHRYDLYRDDLIWLPSDHGVIFEVDCSDFFEWGTADTEPLTEKNIDSLEQLLEEHSRFDHDQVLVIKLWCCVQRDMAPMRLRAILTPPWFQEELARRWS